MTLISKMRNLYKYELSFSNEEDITGHFTINVRKYSSK